MPLSMYQACVPPLVRTLGNLSAILDKAAAHAAAKGIDPSVFVGARLAPDMYPLSAHAPLQDVAPVRRKGLAAQAAPAPFQTQRFAREPQDGEQRQRDDDDERHEDGR